MAYASAEDVAVRLARSLTGEETGLVEVRLEDAERMIRRRIPDLDDRVSAGLIDVQDVIQVEADAVVRVARNPDGFTSETDGNYTYQMPTQLATARLTILPEEWAILGVYGTRMSTLVPSVLLGNDQDRLEVTPVIDPLEPVPDPVIEPEVDLTEAEVRALIEEAVGPVRDQVSGLSDQIAELTAAVEALAGGGNLQVTGGLDTDAVNALIEAQLTAMGPHIQAAINSQVGSVSEQLTLNTSTGADGKVTILTNNLTSAQWAVDLDVVTQQGGVLTVNGKRVLTVDDVAPAGLQTDAVQGLIAAAVAGKADKTELQTLMNAIVGVAEAPGTAGKVGNWCESVRIRLQQDYENLDQLYKMLTGKADKAVLTQVQADLQSLELLVGNEYAKKQEVTDFLSQFYYDKAQIDALVDLLGAGGQIDLTDLQAALDSKASQDEFQRIVDLLGGDLTVGTTTVQQAVSVFSGLNQIITEQLVEPKVAEVRTKLQTIIDAFAGKPNGTAADVLQWRTGVEEALQQGQMDLQQIANEVVEYVMQQDNELAESLQGLRDAIIGPNATNQTVQEMFWLLNDVLMSLIEVTGIEVPGGGK